MKRVLVTGANGFVGRHLCRVLLQDGHHVTAAVRRLGTAPVGTQEVCVGDLGGNTDWSDALHGQDVVVHLAARVHVMDETELDPSAAFNNANTLGTRRLAEQAIAASVGKFVYVSSIKANGEGTASKPFSADDRPNPVDAYGVSKFRAEQELRGLETISSLDVIVLRPPLIYGDGVGGNLLRLMKATSRGIPLPFKSVRNSRAMISVENFVRIISLCVSTSRSIRLPLLVADGESLSTGDLVRELCIGMGRNPRLVHFPLWILKAIGSMSGRRAEVDRLVGSLDIASNILILDSEYEEHYSAREALRLMAAGFVGKRG